MQTYFALPYLPWIGAPTYSSIVHNAPLHSSYNDFFTLFAWTRPFLVMGSIHFRTTTFIAPLPSFVPTCRDTISRWISAHANVLRHEDFLRPVFSMLRIVSNAGSAKMFEFLATSFLRQGLAELSTTLRLHQMAKAAEFETALTKFSAYFFKQWVGSSLSTWYLEPTLARGLHHNCGTECLWKQISQTLKVSMPRAMSPKTALSELKPSLELAAKQDDSLLRTTVAPRPTAAQLDRGLSWFHDLGTGGIEGCEGGRRVKSGTCPDFPFQFGGVVYSNFKVVHCTQWGPSHG